MPEVQFDYPATVNFFFVHILKLLSPVTITKFKKNACNSEYNSSFNGIGHYQGNPSTIKCCSDSSAQIIEVSITLGVRNDTY